MGGSQLPAPIFTPATKAEVGEHDENVSYEEVAHQIGAETAALLRQTTLAVYGRGRDIARDRGILLADTKFEFGFDNERLVIADEVLTPTAPVSGLPTSGNPAAPSCRSTSSSSATG